MKPIDKIRTWIKDNLDKEGRGSRKRLADFLGLEPIQITRMLNTDPQKDTREIKADEYLKIKEFFKEKIPSELNPDSFGMKSRQNLLDLFEQASPEDQEKILSYVEFVISKEKSK